MPTPGVACPPVSGVDLLINKAATTPSALAGSKINFVIEWSNLGDGAFTSVLVTDTLPLHLTFESSNPAPDPTSSTATTKVWNFTNLTAAGRRHRRQHDRADGDARRERAGQHRAGEHRHGRRERQQPL